MWWNCQKITSYFQVNFWYIRAVFENLKKFNSSKPCLKPMSGCPITTTVFRVFSERFLTVFLLISECFPVVFWLFSDCFLTVFWLLSDCFPIVFRMFFGCFLTVFLLTSSCFPTVFRPTNYCFLSDFLMIFFIWAVSIVIFAFFQTVIKSPQLRLSSKFLRSKIVKNNHTHG